ncbi:DUF1573 domain-containing protein [Mucilaginibacter lacusdianchii]|uniref:DUF1573 domain-containing protein n=1 Tax=Mucilaginibacter lacusdianchii TaxID=2684211 RepID=UPI00131D9CEA|nr:DUF1573 domain-containing protein [Mucilaginibacter sp. JXJ CY 39]
MKNILAVLCIAGALTTACNQSQKSSQPAATSTTSIAATATPLVDSASAPVLKFDKEAYDFGKIKTGDKVTYEFKFTNAGKTPLIINDAVASCGCTKPEYENKPIQPGEGGAIKVTFNSAGKVGLQDKMITITANTAPAQSVVHLTGEVTEK